MPQQDICQCQKSPFAQPPFVILSICEDLKKHHISPRSFYNFGGTDAVQEKGTLGHEGRSAMAGFVLKEKRPMFRYRQIELVDDGDVALVRLFDHTLANRLQIANAARAWLSVITAEHCHNLLLDCSGMQRLSSDVLSALIVLDRRLKRRKAKMSLCGVSPAIRATFSITQLDRLFEIRDRQAYRSLA